MRGMGSDADFRSSLPIVAPSLLLCDFGNLQDEVRAVEAAGAKCLHLDVMDGVFVDNITYGMPIVEAVRRATKLPLDVHLMISNPSRYVKSFVAAGADGLTVHFEAMENPREVLEKIRASGAQAGMALNPSTSLDAASKALAGWDLILAMSVEPGFGAQKFDETTLDKLRALRSLVPPDTLLEVDGGVNRQTIGRCAAAGAQLLVAGSAIFRRSGVSYAESMAELTRLARSPE